MNANKLSNFQGSVGTSLDQFANKKNESKFEFKASGIKDKDAKDWVPDDRVLISDGKDGVELINLTVAVERKNKIVYRLSELDIPILPIEEFNKMDSLEPYQSINPRKFKRALEFERVIAISHKWATSNDPDVDSIVYNKIRSKLKGKTGIGLFIDYCCLPQNTDNYKRSNEEQQLFDKCLKQMNKLYALADVVLIVSENIDRYRESSWCTFESAISTLRRTTQFVDPFVLKTNELRFGVSDSNARKLVDGIFNTTVATNGSDLVKIKSMMIQFITKDFEEAQNSELMKRQQILLNIDVQHSSKWILRDSDGCCGAKFKLINDDDHPLNKQEQAIVESEFNNQNCCNPSCSMKSVAVSCVSLASFFMCSCCIVIPISIKKCILWSKLDRDGFTKSLQHQGFKVEITDYTDGIGVEVFKMVNHIVNYTTIATNLEETAIELINRIYGGFDAFIKKSKGGSIDYEVLIRMRSMNSIGFEEGSRSDESINV